MEYKIQSLVFPTDEKHRGCRKLFYRGDHAILDTNEKSLSLGYGQRCDFVTYLNACSYQKWKRYTFAGKLTLHLEFEGEVELLFLGYNKDALTVERIEYDTMKFENKKRGEITYTFPENNEQMVGFEISGLSHCKIYGGYYTVEVDKKNIDDVVLSLATTTCNKEEFIKKNVELLKTEILETGDEMAENFYLHVVDNGRTLTNREIKGKHIFLHPNMNAGGAGGFARGMIESMHQRVEATHVLLMDDDVLVLPESIRRTYNLLKLLRPEYCDAYISGAMLRYEQPEIQHEDIGNIDDNCAFHPLKASLNHMFLADNLENERNYTQHKNSYAAWWYCCIPVRMIKKNGLPLPVFIRSDDAEYGLRSNTQFITMNGICIWHMGFLTKYNTTLDKYQALRNMMIAQAVSGVMPKADFVREIYSSFRVEIMRFNYNAADLVISALEDFMKGPEWLKTLDGEKILQEHFKLNDQLVPLSELPEGNSFKPHDCYANPPLSFKNRVLLRLTWNGQRWTPKFLEKDGVVPIGFDWVIQAERIAMHTKLIAVNPFNETGVYRVKDKERYQALMKRYRKVMRDYKKRGAAVREAYKAAGPEMKSEKFWREYLKLDESEQDD